MNPIETFVEFVSNRARKAGYAAFQAGVPGQAPMEFGEYSGAWVEGWNAAALDSFGVFADTRAAIA